MVKSFKLLFLICFFFNSISIGYAAIALSFGQKPSIVSLKNIDSFLKTHQRGNQSDYDIAENDLNNDGLQEFVLRPKTCPSDPKPCQYMILAENKNKIYILGMISAYKLMLSGTFSNGIQDFLAFQSDNNDYEYERYIWSPTEARYILEKVQ